MINNDIIRLELDVYPGKWIATIFCVNDQVAQKPRVYEMEIKNTRLGKMDFLSVAYELGMLLSLDTGSQLDWEQHIVAPGDVYHMPCVSRPQGMTFFRCEKYK